MYKIVYMCFFVLFLSSCASKGNTLNSDSKSYEHEICTGSQALAERMLKESIKDVFPSSMIEPISSVSVGANISSRTESGYAVLKTNGLDSQRFKFFIRRVSGTTKDNQQVMGVYFDGDTSGTYFNGPSQMRKVLSKAKMLTCAQSKLIKVTSFKILDPDTSYEETLMSDGKTWKISAFATSFEKAKEEIGARGESLCDGKPERIFGCLANEAVTCYVKCTR